MADSGCHRNGYDACGGYIAYVGGGGGAAQSLSAETLTLIRKPYVHKIARFDCLHIFAATCCYSLL